MTNRIRGFNASASLKLAFPFPCWHLLFLEQARAIGMGERTPWGGFARVIRNGDLGALQDEPEYQAAKAGDKQAALDLVDLTWWR